MKRLLIRPNHTRGEGMVTSEFVSRKVKGKNQILISRHSISTYASKGGGRGHRFLSGGGVSESKFFCPRTN
jgi:hypothetical protein